MENATGAPAAGNSSSGEKRIKNLDLKCAELGSEIAGIKGLEEKHLSSSLAVLEEQGLYAFCLYLKAKVGSKDNVNKEKKAGFLFWEECCSFLKEVLDIDSEPAEKKDLDLEFVKKVAEDLHRLLLARDLIRRSIAYARYHLKAEEESS
jgi:hypothetical protein